MLKILQVRLQQYVKQELPDVQARFRKVRGTRDQIAKMCRITEKASRVVWYSHLLENFPQFVVIHTVKGFGMVNKAVDVFLEFSCILYDPTDVGNLISGSSAFSKSSLNIWMFMVHILLKPALENFERYFASV